MYRNITFRGFNPERGWVYGFPIERDGLTYITERSTHSNTVQSQFAVSAPSVGQFTGSCDVNGTNIYEGDILVWGEVDEYGNFACNISANNPPYEVRFVDGCFATVNPSGDYRYGHMYSHFTQKHYIVIGNIHDDPTLMAMFPPSCEYRPYSDFSD